MKLNYIMELQVLKKGRVIIMLKLYENIKKYRKLNNLTQEQLAQKMGYSGKSMISKIERGEVDLSQSKIQQLSNIFGITADELMGMNNKIIEYEEDKSELFKEYEDKVRKIFEKNGYDEAFLNRMIEYASYLDFEMKNKK